MTKTMFSVITILAAVSGATAHAEPADFYRLQPLVVEEVPPTTQELYSIAPPPLAVARVAEPPAFEIDWATLVTIGEKVIEIVKAGKPVTNITRDAVSVVPAGLESWDQLSGWKAPVTKVYRVTAKNYFGMTVIDLRIKASAMYGGGFNGHGKYLANVILVPTSVYVLWGFTCNVWSEHRDPVNLGSKSDPVAGLGFDLRYQYGSPVNMETGAQDLFITGNGEITAP